MIRDLFHIIGDRESDAVILDLIQNKPGFFFRLFNCFCLGEEIHSEINACFCCTFHVLMIKDIFMDLAGFIAAVSDAYKGEFHACFFDLLPVDLFVMHRYIDAYFRLIMFVFIYPELIAAVHIFPVIIMQVSWIRRRRRFNRGLHRRCMTA